MYKKIEYPGVTFSVNYKINERGEVWSEKYNRQIRIWPDRDGYLRTTLMVVDGSSTKRRNFPVHRLVLMTFNPVPDMMNLQVNHIDNNRLNPNLDNLEWVTAQENVRHMMKQNRGRVQRQNGENNLQSILTENEVKEIIQILLLPNRPTYKYIGRLYGVDAETIGAIKRKVNWTHLTKDINFD